MLKNRKIENERRGVVLIIALGLLALFAAVGISFAVISKYEGYSARNFKRVYQGTAGGPVDLPARDMAQFGISQLIYDTRRTNSALRGHSLLRDMYGSPIANDGSDGADPEAKEENVEPKQYVGAFNGTGIFAPLDTPAAYPIADTNLRIVGNSAIPGTIEPKEVAYFLGKLRPIIGFDSAGTPIVTAGSPGVDPNFFPIFPFNFVHFDRLGNRLGTNEHPATQNREPEKYTLGGPTGPVHFFGYDEDYDYPDHNNMFLAMERADGQIIIPSFHRPHLIRQFEEAGVFTDNYNSLNAGVGRQDTRRLLAWRDNTPEGRGRSVLLRPREMDVNASVVFNQVSDPVTGRELGNRWRDLLDLDGSGAVGDSPEELDVDTDGDGIKDAIWIDLGHPVQTVNGKTFKPLFAFKVLSLDGKINLNAHGNFLPKDLTELGGPADTGLEELHNSNLGASVTEINPKHAFLLGDIRAGNNELPMAQWQKDASGSGIGPNEYAKLLGVSNDNVNLGVGGRYTKYGQTPVVTDRAGLSHADNAAGADDNGQADPFYANEYDLSAHGLFAGRPDWNGLGYYFAPFEEGFTGMPPADIKALSGRFVNYPGEPGSNRTGVNRTYDGTQLNPNALTTDDAIEMNLYNDSTSDWAFDESDLERLYRSRDIDAAILSPRLAMLFQNSFGSPAIPAGWDDAAHADYATRQSILLREEYARQRMRRLFTHASWDLIKFNFPPYFTSISDQENGTVLSEDHAERESGTNHHGGFPLANGASNLLLWIADGLHTRLNLNGPDKFGDPDPLRPYTVAEAAVVDGDRSRLAAKIYILLNLAVRPSPTNPTRSAQARALAQLAVNIVDFMDGDDVMTMLAYDEDITTFAANFDPANPPPDPNKVVFGFELPRLVVNEAMVIQYQHNDGSVFAPSPYDKDTVWVFAELFNPWSAASSGTVDLIDPLPGVARTDGYSAYQLRVIDQAANSVQVVDFKFPTTDMDQSPAFPTVADTDDWAKVRPNSYFLVGPPAPNDIDLIVDTMATVPKFKEAPASKVLFEKYDPTVGSGGGKLNSFTSDTLKFHRTHVDDSTYDIGIYRLRNPFAPFDGEMNPYVRIDHVTIVTSNTGLSARGGGFQIEDFGDVDTPGIDQRNSRERLKAWQGETRPGDLQLTDFPIADDYNIYEYLGTPDMRKPNLDGFVARQVPFNTEPLHSLFLDPDIPVGRGAQNPGASVFNVSFPFLNRRLATPLELLSVRLYGTHQWQPNTVLVLPAGAAPIDSPEGLREWRLRFTDDYSYDESSSAGTRNHRDRVVPWLEDNREIHPFDRSTWSPPSAQPTAPMLPDLFRFFEFVECRSRMLGAEQQDSENSLYPRRVRVPGKICLNTITDEEVFRALFDDPWVMPSQAVNSSGEPIDLGSALLDPVIAAQRPLAGQRIPTNYWRTGSGLGFPFDPRHNLSSGRLFRSSWGDRQTPGTVFHFGHDPVCATPSVGVVQFHDPTSMLADADIQAAIERQWPGIVADSSPLAIAPGRDPRQQVHSEVYRMFLLSRAGRDGITGTGDDKPFRSFAAPRLSDTILRQRNYAHLDGPEGTRVGDPAMPAGSGEYLVNLVNNDPNDTAASATRPHWTPRLFDPVANPYPFGTTVAMTPSWEDRTKETLGVTASMTVDYAAADVGPLKIAAAFPLNARDAWMLETERNRLLAKISGNVTTRSNVYACWMTVGFFAVEPGTENSSVPCLNEEIGIDNGTNIRHRVFFVVDRSKATKYDGPPESEDTVSIDTMNVLTKVTIIE